MAVVAKALNTTSRKEDVMAEDGSVRNEENNRLLGKTKSNIRTGMSNFRLKNTKPKREENKQ